MPTSAKRLGLDVKGNIELELRLRRIETELENRVRVTDLDDGDTARVNEVPIVTGLRVAGSTPGAITIAWTSVRISDLKRYELDIAENLGFSENLVTNFVGGTEFNYTTNSDTGGGGDTDVFVRVRARAQSGNVGEYSVVLNATTGQAQSEDIATDAVGNDEAADALTIQLALKEYITPRGFHMTNNTGDVQYLDITAGVARGEQNDGSIETTTTLTKRINQTWLPGNAGGFPSSFITLADATDYLVFAIGKTDGTGGDFGFDTDPDAANLIAQAVTVDSGYTNAIYRQIGVHRFVSAAIGIRPFFSPAREPELILFQNDSTQTTLSYSTALRTATADIPANTTGVYSAAWFLDNNTSAYRYMWLQPTDWIDQSSAGTAHMSHSGRQDNTDDVTMNVVGEVQVDASSQYVHRFSSTSGSPSFRIVFRGYRFLR